MIDGDGYRPNVGIILCNKANRVFLGKRLGEESWQFPQGGIDQGESPEDAMFRELEEEVGLKKRHVEILAKTQDWLRYDVPVKWIKPERRHIYKGQKQIWFLLRLVGKDSDVSLEKNKSPEFDGWRWGDYWVPLNSIIKFKREVYRHALVELAPHLKLPVVEGYKHVQKVSDN